jgi:hypothetical protein
MEFDKVQVKIIESIHNGTIKCLKDYINNLKEEGFKVENEAPNSEGEFLRISLKQEVNNITIENRLGEFLIVWNFLKRNDLIFLEEVGQKRESIRLDGLKGFDQRVEKLNNLCRPYWGFEAYGTIELDEFIKNKFKTIKELEIDLNEKRLTGEKVGRWIANGLTMIAVISSVIFGWINTNNSKDMNIKRIQIIPDTVKVMYYNPPKDTSTLILKSK